MFVSKHGGQSEIILRVKQGDNPAFGFLMPDHHLHEYFRFLVDHQELLNPGIDGGNSSAEKNESQGLDQTGGALSLLGSVYDSGEDEDEAAEKNSERKRKESEEAVADVQTSLHGTEQTESSHDSAKKDGGTSKNSISTLKEKVPVIKRNHSINTIKAATTAKAKKVDAEGSLPNVVDKSLTSLPSATKIEQPIVEPPSELKRVIEKIVEFILKNGREFEAVLAEQDRAHGRFPFLLPSNRYHPYYLEVLQNAQEVGFLESSTLTLIFIYVLLFHAFRNEMFFVTFYYCISFLGHFLIVDHLPENQFDQLTKYYDQEHLRYIILISMCFSVKNL